MSLTKEQVQIFLLGIAIIGLAMMAIVNVIQRDELERRIEAIEEFSRYQARVNRAQTNAPTE